MIFKINTDAAGFDEWGKSSFPFTVPAIRNIMKTKKAGTGEERAERPRGLKRYESCIRTSD